MSLAVPERFLSDAEERQLLPFGRRADSKSLAAFTVVASLIAVRLMAD